MSRIINVTIYRRSRSYHQKHNCKLSASTIAARLQGPSRKRGKHVYIHCDEIRISRSMRHGQDRESKRIAKTRDCEVDCEEINASHRVLIDERNRARQDYEYVCSLYAISAVQSICISVERCVTICDGDDAVLQCAPSCLMPLIDFTGRKHASALRLIGN